LQIKKEYGVMTQTTWEKPAGVESIPISSQRGRWKFIIGGILIFAAVGYLIYSGTAAGARLFVTVDDLLHKSEYAGKTVRIAGAVLGDSIKYDSENLIVEFTLVNIPQEGGEDLAKVLHDAVNNPNASRIPVRVENEAKPDLLQNEAQAILTGKLGSDGIFHASELLLKCPSRYQAADPNQAVAQPGK
jgi:cytochrome c-type biogenesis protein CcmE